MRNWWTCLLARRFIILPLVAVIQRPHESSNLCPSRLITKVLGQKTLRDFFPSAIPFTHTHEWRRSTVSPIFTHAFILCFVSVDVNTFGLGSDQLSDRYMATISTNTVLCSQESSTIVRISYRQDARQAIIFLQAPPLAVSLVAKALLLGYIATVRAMRICFITRAILFFELRDKEEAVTSIRQPRENFCPPSTSSPYRKVYTSCS
jgi:hypothetical protein